MFKVKSSVIFPRLHIKLISRASLKFASDGMKNFMNGTRLWTLTRRRKRLEVTTWTQRCSWVR